MGEKSYNKIKLNFSLDIIVDKYQDTFETLLSSKKSWLKILTFYSKYMV